MEKIDNIHDNFFKTVFSKIDNIKDFLFTSLPADIQNYIDFENIEIDNTSYVSENFKGYFSDVVVKTRIIDSEMDIYILFEHKSYQDKKIFIQLLRYMYLMWNKDIGENKPLRVIIPLVFYHGKKKWKLPVKFLEQFKIKEELKNYLLDFQYILFDTNEWNFEEELNSTLKNNVFLLTALSLMKSAYQQDMETIEKVFDFWYEKGFIKNTDDIIFFMIYICGTKDIDEEKLTKLLEEKKLERSEIMATLAQRWVKEGREKGREEGREEGIIIDKQDVLISQLNLKFGLTEVEKALIKKTKDIKKLDEALKAFVFANEKQEVISCLK